ncbi:hypothetical protein GALL_317020 [mine drainage metagenome]|uniref:Uncharacterized protein n=1 Tax=mine drainage metagenome TaxID=410659 RepID=A0A1J5R305_9ZZZZ
MTESRACHDAFRTHIPDEVRQHLDAARTEMRKGLETFLPEAFFDHRDSARREMLLAWRGVLDTAIQHMDEKPSKA